MKNIFERIYERHSKLLKNLNVSNIKMVICFSGIPGSGKTTLAKKLERRYKAVRINTHEIGRIIKNLIGRGNENRKIQNEYQFWLLRNKPFINGLIILDSGIDRKYNEVFKNAKKKKYGVFVIRIDISDSSLRERIRKREGKNAIKYLKEFERWKKEFDDFGKNVKSDVVLGDKIDLKGIYNKIDKLMIRNIFK